MKKRIDDMARSIQAWWYRRKVRKHKFVLALSIADSQTRYMMSRTSQEANV